MYRIVSLVSGLGYRFIGSSALGLGGLCEKDLVILTRTEWFLFQKGLL